jgi:hypothetical protein
VRQLAADAGLELIMRGGWTKAEAWVEERAVRVPAIRSGRDYLVALHELGHILSPHARGLHEAGVLYDEISCEGYAWAWAAAHAEPALAIAISAREWALAGKGFVSYLRFAATSTDGWPRYLPAEAGVSGSPISLR